MDTVRAITVTWHNPNSNWRGVLPRIVMAPHHTSETTTGVVARMALAKVDRPNVVTCRYSGCDPSPRHNLDTAKRTPSIGARSLRRDISSRSRARAAMARPAQARDASATTPEREPRVRAPIYSQSLTSDRWFARNQFSRHRRRFGASRGDVTAPKGFRTRFSTVQNGARFAL